jgi:hypothetical protein
MNLEPLHSGISGFDGSRDIPVQARLGYAWGLNHIAVAYA